MGATIFQGNKVKALKNEFQILNGMSVINLPANPMSTAYSAEPGSIGYFSGNHYIKNDSGLTTNWSRFLSGTGRINYITNGTFDDSISGCSLYNDGAVEDPSTGDGNAANFYLAKSRETTSPLYGTGSLLLTKTNGPGSARGEGLSIDFTSSRISSGRMVDIEFDYLCDSGYADDEVRIWIYKKDATTRMLQPTPYKLKATTVPGHFKAQVQLDYDATLTNVDDWRLIFHVAGTGTADWNIWIDNLVVGPTQYAVGAPVTDWKDYVPTTNGFGTVTWDYCKWRRVGSDIEIEGKFTSGTSTAAPAYISPPSGISFNPGITGIAYAGEYKRASTNEYNSGPMIVNTGNGSSVFFGLCQAHSAAGWNILAIAQGSQIIASGDAMIFRFKTRVLGWSSSCQMSDDADTRVVASKVYGDAASAAANAPIIFPSVAYDKTGSYNVATGEYTVKAPGVYKIFGYTHGGSVVNINLYKNGVHNSRIGANDIAVAGSVECVAGDILTVRPSNTYDSGSESHITFERISGPSAIAASEKVIEEWNSNATTTVATNAAPLFEDKVQSTHGAYNPATGIFTAPKSGQVRILGGVRFDDPVAGTYIAAQLRTGGVSGTVVKAGMYYTKDAILAIFLAHIDFTYPVNAGDQLAVTLTHNKGSAVTFTGTAADEWISFTME